MGSLARLAQKYAGTLLGASSRGWGGAQRLVGIGAQLSHPHVFRRVVEQASQQQENRAADDAGDPEGHPDPYAVGAEERQGIRPGLTLSQREECYQAHHDGRHDHRANPLGRLEQSHAQPQVTTEPGRHRHGEGNLEYSHGGAEHHAEKQVEMPELSHESGQDHADDVQ